MSEENSSNEVLQNQEVTDSADSLDSLNALPEEKGEESAIPQADFNRKFAALSRKDKEQRDTINSYKDRIEQMEAELQSQKDAEAAQEKPKEALPLEYRLKRDPLGTLAELGLTYEQLTKLELNDGKLSTEAQMMLMKEDLESDYASKIQNLEERLNSKEKAEEEARHNKQVERFNAEISEFITSNVAEFELIQATESQDLVHTTIEQHYQNQVAEGIREEDRKILSIEEAANAVEAHLSEEAEKVFKVNKYADRIKSALKPEEERQSPPTLSNVHSATSSSVVDPKLSDEESKAQAAKLIQWD